MVGGKHAEFLISEHVETEGPPHAVREKGDKTPWGNEAVKEPPSTKEELDRQAAIMGWGQMGSDSSNQKAKAEKHEQAPSPSPRTLILTLNTSRLGPGWSVSSQ